MLVPPPEAMLKRLRSLPLTAAVLAALGQHDAPAVALVGGVVRDLLLGAAPRDVDLVAEGPVAEVANRLGDAVEIHDRFDTASVKTALGAVDLARARTETYPFPGALPDIVPSTIEADLARRDFTANAIAIRLTGTEAGSVIAYPGSVEDLGAGRLAVLHPRSFIDDPTRLFRLARYRARLGFEIASATEELAADAVAAGALGSVSGSRIGNELRLLALEAEPVAAFEALSELGLDTAVEPAFGLADRGDELRDALAALPAEGRPDLLAIAAASTQVRAPKLDRLLDRLAFSAADREIVFDAATRTDSIAARLAVADRPSEIAAAVDGSTIEALALTSAKASTGARRNAIRWLEQLRHVELQITGDDLTAAGVIPGPMLGAGLRAAYHALLDGNAPTRDRQLEIALAVAQRSPDRD